MMEYTNKAGSSHDSCLQVMLVSWAKFHVPSKALLQRHLPREALPDPLSTLGSGSPSVVPDPQVYQPHWEYGLNWLLVSYLPFNDQILP